MTAFLNCLLGKGRFVWPFKLDRHCIEMDRDLAEATELLFHSYATASLSSGGKHHVSGQGMAKLAADCGLLEERTGLTFDKYEDIISRCSAGGEGQVSRTRCVGTMLRWSKLVSGTSSPRGGAPGPLRGYLPPSSPFSPLLSSLLFVLILLVGFMGIGPRASRRCTDNASSSSSKRGG